MMCDDSEGGNPQRLGISEEYVRVLNRAKTSAKGLNPTKVRCRELKVSRRELALSGIYLAGQRNTRQSVNF